MFVVLMFLLSFLLPVGGWLEFEGYELFGLLFLFFGWVPIAVMIGNQIEKNERDERPE